jgi:ribosomal protein L33
MDECLDSVEIFRNAATLALDASKSNMYITNANIKTNIDGLQKRANNTSHMKLIVIHSSGAE